MTRLVVLWIVCIGSLVVTLGLFLVEGLLPEEDPRFDLLLSIDVVAVIEGSFCYFIFLRMLQKRTRTRRRASARGRRASTRVARSGSRPRVTSAQDVETIRRKLQRLVQGIAASKKTAGWCLAIQMTCLDAKRELQEGEREIFFKYSFAARARSVARHRLKSTRDMCEKLIAGGKTLDAECVALLKILLLAERACRECRGGPEDGECGALEVVSPVEIDTGGIEI